MTEIKDRLSWSSLSQYMECGERWRLARAYHLDRTTWYATLAGTACHEIVEQFNRTGVILSDDELRAEFVRLFDLEIEARLEAGETIKASGKTLKSIGLTGGPNKKDRAWWLVYGPRFARAWIDFRLANPHLVVAIGSDGEPLIEAPFDVMLGSTRLRGFIDCVFVDTRTGELVVVDYKTGKRPESALQLAVYRYGLRVQYGITASWGAFFCPQEVREESEKYSARDGLGRVYDLGLWTDEYVSHLFVQARAGVEAGVFLPNVTSMCRGCPVQSHCRAVGGASTRPGVLATGVPVPVVEHVVLVSAEDEDEVIEGDPDDDSGEGDA